MSIAECAEKISANKKPVKTKMKMANLETRVGRLRVYLLRPIVNPDDYYRDLKKILLRGQAIGVLFMALCASALASDVSVAPPPATPSHVDTRRPVEKSATVEAWLIVSAPASNAEIVHKLKLPKGSNAGDALRAVYDVETGLVCADSREVKCVNGLCVDPYTEKWWVVLVNGNIQNSSARSVLADDDVVEWRYEEAKWAEPSHVRLEEWVAKAQKGDES